MGGWSYPGPGGHRWWWWWCCGGGLSLSGGRRDVSNCWERRAIDAASSIDGIRTRLRAALLHRRRGGWRAGSHISMRFVCGSAVTPSAPPPTTATTTLVVSPAARGSCERRIKPAHRVCRALFALRSCFSGLCKVCKSLRHTFMPFFFLRREPNYKHVEVDSILWTRRYVWPRSPPP